MKAKLPPFVPSVKLVAMPTKLVVVPSVEAIVPPLHVNDSILSVPTGAKVPELSCTVLVPKADEGHYKKLEFVVDPATFEVKETVVHDPVGNVNHMRFLGVKRNIAIAPAVFQFKPPRGVPVTESPELKP